MDRRYIGQTSDLASRIKAHNSGESTYTQKGIPWTLLWSGEVASRK
ncbi:MAG: GIY-YIG nuclease family protein [Bacteroidia bacterium]|nr:GIY-YIG nuclease family protein [Bacteroidia bacterium]